MAAHTQLDREAELVQRFTRDYRSKLADAVRLLNRSLTAPTDRAAVRASLHSVRCCVEAVDMVLASHEQFAVSIRQLGQDSSQSRRAA